MLELKNSIILYLTIHAIPFLSISFVGTLLFYKLYIKIRSKFNANVNCWFCNLNTKVPYLESNSWTCPHCQQYNGFNKNGDYNREIFQQFDCSNTNISYTVKQNSNMFDSFPTETAQNGLCNFCNESLRLKVEKLAQFEPKNESKFKEELEVYKLQLEKQFRLCSSCNRYVKKVLSDKKKMVLGCRIFDNFLKNAVKLKDPYLKNLQLTKQLQWKRVLNLLIIILSVMNLYCLSHTLPNLTRNKFTDTLGENVGHQLFIMVSHVTAIVRALSTYLDQLNQYELFAKTRLFIQTLILMILYSVGFKPHKYQFDFHKMYLLGSPFALLVIAFLLNILDRFKITRFTFLLVLWSTFASGLISESLPVSNYLLLICSSYFTLLCGLTNKTKRSSKLHDSSIPNYHKLYSDSLSDDETNSMISQELDSSSASVHSNRLNKSFSDSRSQRSVQSFNGYLRKSPATSSMMSLNDRSRNQYSSNTSFKPFNCVENNSSQRSLYNFPNRSLSHSQKLNSNGEFGSQQRLPSFGYCDNSHNPSQNFFVAPQTCREGFSIPPAGRHTFNTTPLLSPFTSSSSYYPNSVSNFATPLGYINNCLNSNSSTTSWLSGGYFNQRIPTKYGHNMPKDNIGFEQLNNGTNVIEDNLSRASSQSSGFESQNGRVNMSRENSCCRDVSDSLPTTLQNDCQLGPYASRPLLTPSLFQPPSINCPPPSSTTSGLWQFQPANRGTTNSSNRDSFNFHQINKELHTLRDRDSDHLQKLNSKTVC